VDKRSASTFPRLATKEWWMRYAYPPYSEHWDLKSAASIYPSKEVAMALEQQHCEACRADAPHVSEQEKDELHREVPEWKQIEENGEERLQRQFRFRNFVAALAFTNRVGELAEEQQHHPALLTEYGKVTVTWWTHKIGGLHRNDFICAARTDRIFQEYGSP